MQVFISLLTRVYSPCLGTKLCSRNLATREYHQRHRTRYGATVIAVLVVLSIVCLLAHQTAKTLFLLRRGEEHSVKIAQAQEVLELGHRLKQHFENDIERLTNGPLIIEMGHEFAKLDFITEKPPRVEKSSDIRPADDLDEDDNGGLAEGATSIQRESITRIIATWPVDSLGAEIPSRIPIVVTWEKAIH